MIRYFLQADLEDKLLIVKYIVECILLVLCIAFTIWFVISYVQVLCHNIDMNEVYEYPKWNFFVFFTSFN
jgi:hypothetical protein